MNSEHCLSISLCIIESLSKLREDNELNDFEVIVDGETFSCHSVILASCSDFFRGLLRSNMKEKLEMKVQLSNISSHIFQLILKTLYNGCELLTQENVLEVWSAVHQLQIQFLIKHCEVFVESSLSLDTLWAYKQRAEILQSDRICKLIFNFMCENFSTFRKTEAMLRLNYEDLMEIITSDQLKVTSEDEVLYSIVDWVSYTDLVANKNNEQSSVNNICSNVNFETTTEDEQIDTSIVQKESNCRKDFLIPLLKSCRYCLATENCIASLHDNELISSDNVVIEISLEALKFQFLDYWHGHWPTAAIHRECSNLEHVGVFLNDKEILAFSLKKNDLFCIQSLPQVPDAKLTVFRGKLYACSEESYPNAVYVLQKQWLKVAEISHGVQLFLTHRKRIYSFHYNGKLITRFNPETNPITLETFTHEIENLDYALSFYNCIVVFSSVAKSGVLETAVHSWNTETNVWTKLDNLTFSPQNMISFRSDRDTYILQCNGNLLKLTNSEMVRFTFIAKLWSGYSIPIGALLFKETLLLFFHDSPQYVDVLKRVHGVFFSRQIWKVVGGASHFVHFVASRNELNPV